MSDGEKTRLVTQSNIDESVSWAAAAELDSFSARAANRVVPFQFSANQEAARSTNASVPSEAPANGAIVHQYEFLAKWETKYSECMTATQSALSKVSFSHGCWRTVVKTSAALLCWAYVVLACCLNFTKSWFLLPLASLVTCVVIVRKVRSHYDGVPPLSLNPCIPSFVLRYLFYFSMLAAFSFSVIYFNYDAPANLISLAGLIVLIVLATVSSHDPAGIKWRPVFMGLSLQFLFALFTLRTQVGIDIFDYLGDLVQEFMDLSNAGIEFVFKPSGMELPYIFAIQGLMVIIFFSSVISVLYHSGVMQYLARSIALVMQYTMHTSATESINAAGNIFVGMTEAPLLIRPFLADMTLSELHAVMTGGFATVAGGVLASYVSMGISASHLISASVMSAPAALAFSKIMYPENQLSPTRPGDHIKLPPSPYKSVIHAISVGAEAALEIVLSIIANLIAFLSMVQLVDATLAYLGSLVDVPELSLELICQYMLFPLAFLLGADLDDCLQVGGIIGTKTLVNEFVGYERLAELVASGSISRRSELIATYALCGFSNIGSIGMTVGGLGAMAPARQPDIAALGLRAFLCGSLACFSTACVAGLLYDEGGHPPEVWTTVAPTLPQATSTSWTS